MNRFAMFASLFCLAALFALPGCSPGPNVPDDGMTMPDAGNTDVVANDDPTPLPDGNPTDSPMTACYPNRTDIDYAPCSTAPSCACRINNDPHNGTFAGTPCFLPDGTPDPNMMPDCLAGTTCAPGQNHCSMDLPPGINAAPFEFEAIALANRWGTGGTFQKRTIDGVLYLSYPTGSGFPIGRGACSGRSCYTGGFLANQKPTEVQYYRLDFDFRPGWACLHAFPLGSIPSATDVTASPVCLANRGPL
jgi:hypothetical protein